MKPYYSDNYVQIYHGDCREILPQLPKVDLVLTDPPYGVSKDTWDILDISLIQEVLDILSQRVEKITLLYASMKNLKQFMDLSPDKLMFCVKDYVQIMPCPIQYATDPILVFYGVNKPPNNPIKMDWFSITTADTANKIKVDHLTIKPPRAISHLITMFSVVSDLILDPFLGSGTTAYCAKKLNRKCIGIEIEEKYCEIAAKRCSQGVFKLNI